MWSQFHGLPIVLDIKGFEKAVRIVRKGSSEQKSCCVTVKV